MICVLVKVYHASEPFSFRAVAEGQQLDIVSLVDLSEMHMDEGTDDFAFSGIRR